MKVASSLACALLALSGTTAIAQVPAPALDPAVPSDPLRRAYFGDLHLHTSNSFDAAWGGVRTTPRDAYRYAQGFAVNYMGHEVKRRVPLDFLAVADHAEYMGVPMQILSKAPEFEGTNWYQSLTEGNRPGFGRIMGAGFRGTEPLTELNTPAIKRANWQEVIRVANEFNQPGRFTSFVAFEWSDTPAGSHHHRVAVFRGPQFPDAPFSALDSRNPQDLWRYADENRARDIDVALIPHNPNLSGGRQFSLNGPDGAPMSREYATIKARNEWLVETTQIKGTSETHPLLSTTDEFANFEIVEHYVNGEKVKPEGSYVRQAFARGLAIAERTGVNPYRFGLVGSSDYHSSTSATEEDNYTGALGDGDFMYGEEAVKRVLTTVNAVLRQPTAALSASGITGVWAEQNTREAIFAALRRSEVFATTGTRMQVRLFAGWNYPSGLVKRRNWVRDAYAGGVPMGSDLPARSGAPRSPRFIVQAMKDPAGANLDRIQIVKVWRENGEDRERVFDVVWSGKRKPDASGKLPAVGNTVDTATATWKNSIGSAELAGEWVDLAFDARQAAVYYARVIEIPTPRWSTYLAVRNGQPLSTLVPATLQERAFTSPVFYKP